MVNSKTHEYVIQMSKRKRTITVCPILEIDILHRILNACAIAENFGIILSFASTCHAAIAWILPILNAIFEFWKMGKGDIFNHIGNSSFAPLIYFSLQFIYESCDITRMDLEDEQLKKKRNSIIYNVLYALDIAYINSRECEILCQLKSTTKCQSIYYFSKDYSRIKSLRKKKGVYEISMTQREEKIANKKIEEMKKRRAKYLIYDGAMVGYNFSFKSERRRIIGYHLLRKSLPHKRVRKRTIYKNIVIKDKSGKKQHIFGCTSFLARCFVVGRNISHKCMKLNYTEILHDLNSSIMNLTAKTRLKNALLMRVEQ